MRNRKIIILFSFILTVNIGYSQTYPNNEDGQFQDMLTPEYYNTQSGGAFRLEVNKLVHFARLIPFQNPLQDTLGQTPIYSITRHFGDEIGPEGTGRHHPANDYKIGNYDTLVNLYASYSGYVSTGKDISRYRNYLTITTDIKDSLNNTIGKLVTFYAHIELDLDSADNINMNGQYINKGDLVSKHLYSGTVGGPHLHFEIRYYRNTDTGTEDFYGGQTDTNTEPSSGPWTYGYWNPNSGYGFANPENHFNQPSLGIGIIHSMENLVFYPNPVKDLLTIYSKENQKFTNYSVFNMYGKKIEQEKILSNNIISINLSYLNSGVYFIKFYDKENKNQSLIRIIKK